MKERIPAELQQFPQWIIWRNENEVKIPYSPITGRKASVTNPNEWSTLDHALHVLSSGHYSGLGFVLSENDPFTFIDLDYTENLTDQQRQVKIFEAFNSFSERSPSGRGLHIIIKGKVPQGRRRAGVEVYSSSRYMTVTGDVFHNVAIADRQELLEILWNELGETHTVNHDDSEQVETDDEIINKASQAANAEKFLKLWAGEWQEYYPSQSEADFALVDILGFYSPNREQIVRLFRQSGLGKRPKAFRNDYINYMLNRVFDNKPPPIDTTALTEALKEKVAAAQATTTLPATPSDPHTIEDNADTLDDTAQPVKRPPGLLGAIADYVLASAPHPVPEIATAAAIALLAGITGRSYNVQGMGLNIYTLMLAPTGRGKEAAAESVDRLLTAVATAGVPAIQSFRGPAVISSGQALIKFLMDNPCCISIHGEFGHTLQNITSRNANASQVMLSQILLDLFSKSGDGRLYQAIIYSDVAKNTKSILNPAFSILAESTPTKLFENVEKEVVTSGLLPRFLLLEYDGPKTPFNKHRQTVPPDWIVGNLAALSALSLQYMQKNVCYHIPLDNVAAEKFDMFREYADNVDGDEIVNDLWTRAYVKVLKLAGLAAIGKNYLQPTIDEECTDWAISLVCRGTRQVIKRFEQGEYGHHRFKEKEQLDELVNVLKKFTNKYYGVMGSYGQTEQMQEQGIVTATWASQRLHKKGIFRRDPRGSKAAMKNIIDMAVFQGLLIPVDMKTRQKYSLGNIQAFFISPEIFRR